MKKDEHLEDWKCIMGSKYFFDFLNICPFSPGGFFTFLVGLAYGGACCKVCILCMYLQFSPCKMKMQEKKQRTKKTQNLMIAFFYRDLKASWGQSLRSVSTCRARHQYLKNPEKEKKILKNYTHSLPRQKAKQSNQNSKKENKIQKQFQKPRNFVKKHNTTCTWVS